MGSDSNDRRGEARRRPEIEPTHIWISMEKSFRARVIDESEGGLGVQIEPGEGTVDLEVGFQVRIEYKARRRTASIAFVDEDDDGLRVGLRWDD